MLVRDFLVLDTRQFVLILALLNTLAMLNTLSMLNMLFMLRMLTLVLLRLLARTFLGVVWVQGLGATLHRALVGGVLVELPWFQPLRRCAPRGARRQRLSVELRIRGSSLRGAGVARIPAKGGTPPHNPKFFQHRARRFPSFRFPGAGG